MSTNELWQLVHECYGEELGFTSDDEEYVMSRLSIQDNNRASEQPLLNSFSESNAKVDNAVSFETQTESSVLSSKLRGSSGPDLSCSSASETENKLDDLKISNQAVCNIPHNGKLLIKQVIQMPVDQLFTILFTNSKFFLDFHTARKTTDFTQSEWVEDSKSGKKIRTVSLTVALTQAIGPKSSQVTETQVILPCSTPGQLYCIDVETVNAGIPYADSFSVVSHYCLNRVSDHESSFELFSEIKYKKNVWGLVKSFIEKNCWASMSEFFNSLMKALAVESEENRMTNKVVSQKSKQLQTSNATTTMKAYIPNEALLKIQSKVEEIPSNNNAPVLGTKTDRSPILSWILLVAVLCLLFINGLLCYKLWSSDDSSAYTVMDLHILKNTPRTEDDWINLLQQQESLHNIEVKKWQRVLNTAAQLLRQTEESLTQLQMSVHPTSTEKMFSVLKSGLKSHNSQNGQHKSEF